MKTRISEQIKDWAYELGFDVVGFAKAELPEQTDAHLDTFLSRDYHGDMEWMATHAARRRAPKALWEDARSAIILGHNYGPDYNPLDKLHEKDRGLISCYALDKDYHDIIKKKLRQLASRIAEESGAEVKLFVDTAPLMEKPLAAQSAVGWQGKHTCLVSRNYGSWLFLGEILTTLELPADAPEPNHCGSCRSCLDICPTNAFIGTGQIDARKCISYLTIEHKGHIPHTFRKAIGNRIYGCDDCLAVCPWNKFAKTASESAYHARENLPNPQLKTLLALDDAEFRALFRKSPVKRIGRDRFIRNVLIAAGNSEDKTLAPTIRALLDDASPLVRAMAVWALGELLADAEKVELERQTVSQETDPDVLDEWKKIKGESHG